MKYVKRRALAKAVTWRVVGTTDTFVWALLITHKPVSAAMIGGAEVFTKIFLYYLHERLWRCAGSVSRLRKCAASPHPVPGQIDQLARGWQPRHLHPQLRLHRQGYLCSVDHGCRGYHQDRALLLSRTHLAPGVLGPPGRHQGRRCIPIPLTTLSAPLRRGKGSPAWRLGQDLPSRVMFGGHHGRNEKRICKVSTNP